MKIFVVDFLWQKEIFVAYWIIRNIFAEYDLFAFVWYVVFQRHQSSFAKIFISNLITLWY